MSFEDFKNRKTLKYPETSKDLFCCTLLLLILCTVRFPSFFYSVFDWDESTITIVGQSVLDGNMPYTDAWDIKPPLIYYVYASFIALFGKSLFAIRLGGLLCIYLSALILFRIGKTIHSRTAGLLAGLFLIIFVSSGISGLSTMTEHILLVPISCILYCLLAVHIDRTKAFAIGLLSGMAVLLKTNIVFETSAVFILLWTPYLNRNDDLYCRAGKGAFFAAGVFLPIAAMVYYYFANGKLDLLLKTTLNTAFGYVGLGSSPLDKSAVFFQNVIENFKQNTLLWGVFSLGSLYLAGCGKEKKYFLRVLLVVLVAQFLSLFITAQPFGYHYFMTSIPILSLVSGIALACWLSESRSRSRAVNLMIIAIILAGSFFALKGNVARYYGDIASDLIQKRPLFNDSCYKISRYLKENGAENHYIYMVNACHIAYWLTGSRYPTKYIHPSNLAKEYMLKIIDGPDATKEQELLAILSKNPLFIVHNKDLWPQKPESFQTILEHELRARYELVQTVDTRYVVFKRRSGLFDQ